MRPQAVLILAAALACHQAAPPPPARDAPGPDGLVAWLRDASAHDRSTIGRAVAATAISATGWATLVSAPYRDHHAAYLAGYPAASAIVVDRLAGGGPIAVRPHYADDATAAASLRRERLALVVGTSSFLVRIADRDLPVAFVYVEDHWRTLAGIDALTRAAIGARDHACGEAYTAARDVGPCLVASAPVATAALTGRDDERVIACRRLIAAVAAGCGEDRGSVAPTTPP